MGISAIVSAIITVAKAVPYVYKILDMINSKWTDYKISQITTQRITKDNQRTALISAISKAPTNEEIMALSVTLHSLNNGSIVQISDS